MSGLNDGSMDRPFRNVAGQAHLPPDAVLSGGVVVASAIVQDDDGNPHPAVIFTFARADGSGNAPPVVLCLQDKQMAGLITLVTAAVRRVLQVVRQHRARRN